MNKVKAPKRGVLLLHGFGAGPGQWDGLRKEMESLWGSQVVLTPDFYVPNAQGQLLGIQSLTSRLVERISKEGIGHLLIVGYSLGGRIGLNLVNQLKSKIDWKLLCLSSRPGIWEAEEIAKRKKFEATWSKKFNELSRDQVQREWNALRVFQDTQDSQFREDLSLSELAESLSLWSPTEHLFSPEDLKKISKRILWRIGEKDLVYREIHSLIQNQGFSQDCRLVEGSGHRILKDRLDAVVEVLRRL